MLKVIAKIFSIMLHPLVMPLVGVFVIFNTENPAMALDMSYKYKIYFMVLFSTGVIPITAIPFFIYNRLINNVEMETSRERVIPFLVTCVFYYVAYYLVNRLDLPHLHWLYEKPILVSFLLSSFVVLVLVTLISIGWKISAHMAGIGGLTGLLLFIAFRYSLNLTNYLEIAILVAGLIACIRLFLNAHKPSQIYTGFLLGIGGTIVTMYTYTLF